MSDTSIEWTDKTWNPVRGCSRVSPGCDKCYAMRQAHRFSGEGNTYEGLTTIRKGKVDWTGKVVTAPGMLDAPLRWRKPRRVFVNSMADLFHESIPDEYIAAVFGVMAMCERHTFQILTKRAVRMRAWFRWYEGTRGAHPYAAVMAADAAFDNAGTPLESVDTIARAVRQPWPLPHVWLGVSCEDQARADERIPLLLGTPAAVRLLSLEPLLGPIALPPAVLGCVGHLAETFGNPLIHWVIVGGESGPGARPTEVESIRDIVRQCREARVACLVKQLGRYPVVRRERGENGPAIMRDSFAIMREWPKGTHFGNPLHKTRKDLGGRLALLRNRKGGDPAEWPDDLRVREYPDGRVDLEPEHAAGV